MAGDLAARRLKTFFVGTETSRNPLLPKLQSVAKQAVAEGLAAGAGVVSARYGKRVIINTGGSQLAELKDTDFVEIVDYDPSKNRCLLMGKAEPSQDAALHWLIYNNREEVGAIVHWHDPLVLEVQEATQMFPETKEAKPPGSVELAVEALKVLRKSPFVVLKGAGCLAVGRTPEDALRIAMQAKAQALEVVEEAEALGENGDGPPPDLDAEPGPAQPGRR
ncbi:MAG TPA: class II aldolase/adducin family protein [Candidatus Thermoplasmatota archaeon]|jgi:ribulose-5-phosphate 4-epimerase/fuculose-1-phosphate aldolase|nr:class II aldolase/adducin family protein [Candidatus Thermoplasmatota archaeon]